MPTSVGVRVGEYAAPFSSLQYFRTTFIGGGRGPCCLLWWTLGGISDGLLLARERIARKDRDNKRVSVEVEMVPCCVLWWTLGGSPNVLLLALVGARLGLCGCF